MADGDPPNAIEAELLQFRRDLRPVDAALRQAYVTGEERRTSVPLVQYTEVSTPVSVTARVQQTEDGTSQSATEPTSPPDPGPSTQFADVLFTGNLYQGGTSVTYPSADAAYSAAVSAATPTNHDHESLATGQALTEAGITASRDPMGAAVFGANAGKAVWHLNLATSTGYLKVYYDILTYQKSVTELDPMAGTTSTTESTSSSAATYEYNSTPVGTSGSPGSYYDTSDQTVDFPTSRPGSNPTPPTYPGAVPSTNEEKTISIQNVRWSAVMGYVPPADGSANGFPP